MLKRPDYYYRSNSLRVIDRIRIPTLIIHAQDDPFIPFAPLRDPTVTNNPLHLLLAPHQGGHVAFISRRPARAIPLRVNDSSESSSNYSRFTIDDLLVEDRFWAENRVIDFCKLAESLRA